MPKSVQELREEGGKLANRIQQLRDKCHSDDGWTEEERQEWQTVGERYNEVTRQADELETVNERANEIARIQEEANERVANPGRGDIDGRSQGGQDGPTEEERSLAVQAWCRAQRGMTLSDRHLEATQRCGIRPDADCLTFRVADTRDLQRIHQCYRDMHPSLAGERARGLLAESRAAMSNQIGASGGNLIPPESFVTSLELNRVAFGGVLQVAETMTTQSGERMSWPTADDTSNIGEQVDSNEQVDNSGAGGPTPNFGKIYWDAYKYSSKTILVPHELFEDSPIMLAATLGSMLGERLGRIENQKFTTGTGNSEPYGIVTRASLGKETASATAIDEDEIIQLEHALDPAYRMGAGYMMHDAITLGVRLLKDNEGRYIWQPGLSQGRPDTLNSRPVTINMDMASSIAASNVTMLFGQFFKYKVRRVREIRLYRLQELYRAKDQDGFVAFERCDGNLLDAGTPPVVSLTQKSS